MCRKNDCSRSPWNDLREYKAWAQPRWDMVYCHPCKWRVGFLLLAFPLTFQNVSFPQGWVNEVNLGALSAAFPECLTPFPAIWKWHYQIYGKSSSVLPSLIYVLGSPVFMCTARALSFVWQQWSFILFQYAVTPASHAAIPRLLHTPRDSLTTMGHSWWRLFQY